MVHPCIGKQQGRIVVRHQGAAGNYLMSLTMEKVEKRLTDLSGALAHNYPEIKLTKYRHQLQRVLTAGLVTEKWE